MRSSYATSLIQKIYILKIFIIFGRKSCRRGQRVDMADWLKQIDKMKPRTTEVIREPLPVSHTLKSRQFAKCYYRYDAMLKGQRSED
jgi:hypothetical protein